MRGASRAHSSSEDHGGSGMWSDEEDEGDGRPVGADDYDDDDEQPAEQELQTRLQELCEQAEGVFGPLDLLRNVAVQEAVEEAVVDELHRVLLVRQGGLSQEEQPDQLPPATEEEIEQLPAAQLTAERLRQAATQDCAVCMQPFTCGQWVAELPCSHLFCRACIGRWLEQHRSCPRCRRDITLPPPAGEGLRCPPIQHSRLQPIQAETQGRAGAPRLSPPPVPRRSCCAARRCRCGAADPTLTLKCGHGFHSLCLAFSVAGGSEEAEHVLLERQHHVVQCPCCGQIDGVSLSLADAVAARRSRHSKYSPAHIELPQLRASRAESATRHRHSGRHSLGCSSGPVAAGRRPSAGHRPAQQWDAARPLLRCAHSAAVTPRDRGRRRARRPSAADGGGGGGGGGVRGGLTLPPIGRPAPPAEQRSGGATLPGLRLSGVM